MGKLALDRAKANRDDEYYTLYKDVEKEIPHYVGYLHGKTVICPCDDPDWSNIYAYLKSNFHKLGLKLLLSSHLENPHSYITTFDGSNIHKQELAGNGDFRSSEVISILEKTDVVITNPPFSLARELLPILHNMHLDYILILPLTVIAYKAVFPYTQSGELHSGYNRVQSFEHSSGLLKKFGNVRWYTTLPVPQIPPLPLTVPYSPITHPKMRIRLSHDLICESVPSDIINVDHLKDIPYDYMGEMAVPITILEQNHSQFNILSVMDDGYVKGRLNSSGKLQEGLSKRIIIQRK